MTDELWPIGQTGDSTETLSSKAGNCGNCPVNQTVRRMTTAGYLEHLSVPAITIMKTFFEPGAKAASAPTGPQLSQSHPGPTPTGSQLPVFA